MLIEKEDALIVNWTLACYVEMQGFTNLSTTQDELTLIKLTTFRSGVPKYSW